MKNDQELGLYDESFIKEAEEAFKKEMESVAPFGETYDLEDEFDDYGRRIYRKNSDWDVTLMDGLEDEEPFFTEEELQNISQEEPTIEDEEQNLSNLEPIMEIDLNVDDEYLTEAIREFNQQSLEDEGWDEEMEKRYWEEEGKEHEPKELTDEPVYQSDVKEIDEMLKIANEAIDEKTSSDSDDEKKK
jgi:hypothetical protein